METKKELFLVATESDGRDPLQSEGAIVFETYTKLATLEHAIERAEKMGNTYGRTFILRCEVVGDVPAAKDLQTQRALAF